MKVKKIAVAIAGLCIVVVVGILSYTHLTTAFFVAEDSKVNVVSMGKMDTNIEEDLHNLEKKNISVKNSGDIDCYVRVMIRIPQIKDSEGKFYTAAVTDCNGRSINLADGNKIVSEGGAWERGSEDGYWYYSKPVAAGSTIPFLDSIKYPDLADGVTVNKEQLDVIIYVESAQADNRGITDVKEAFAFTEK